MSSLLWNYFNETPCSWKGVTCAEAQNTYPRVASWFNSWPSGHDWTPPKTNHFQQFSQWVTSFFALQRNPSRTTNFPEKSHQILPRKFKVMLLLILCGEPTKNPCPIPSSPSSSPPNISAPTSPPAIAPIPRTMNPTPETMSLVGLVGIFLPYFLD